MFKDRIDAGRKLAQEISLQGIITDSKNTVILALPRGGVVVAAPLAEKFKIPLDIIVTRKIGSPLNLEYAIAAVGEHSLVVNTNENIDENYLKKQMEKERKEIDRRKELFRGERPQPNLKDKTVILVDDGLATGLSMKAAIEEVKVQHPKKIFVAVPVAPPETVNLLRTLVDELIILKIEDNFYAIGQFYEFFEQTQDSEVINLLKHSYS